MQRQSINFDGWRKRINRLHDFKALHDFDDLNAHVRIDNRNMMSGKETSSTSLVDVIHQPRYGLDGARALATYSAVGCCDQVRYLGGIELSWQDLDSSNRLAIHQNGLVVFAVFHRNVLAALGNLRPTSPVRRSPARLPETLAGSCLRSEERRVGKECRSRWSPY